MKPGFDLITMGRSSIDLYSNDIGAPFEQISSFAALVGGSPLNIAVGAQRLGLRTSLLTAVGDDKVGDFILAFLQRAFGSHLLVYVLERSEPGNDPAILVAAGVGARATPAKSTGAVAYAISRIGYGLVR